MTVTKAVPGFAMLWVTSRSSRNTGMPARAASRITFAICSVIGAMNSASGCWAIRPLMSWICLDCELLASVIVSLKPSFLASAFMLAVSARRHGLLLAFWLNATVYVLFFFSFGAAVANGTPLGAAELPGSFAVASLHDAAALCAPAECFGADTPVAASAPSASNAAPAHGTIFLPYTS